MSSYKALYQKVTDPKILIEPMTAIEFENWLLTEGTTLRDLECTIEVLEKEEMYERCAVVRDLIMLYENRH